MTQQTVRTAIINARIFDGTRLIDDTTVVFNEGFIEAVGGPVPAGARVIDAKGATLLPGLIDSHVHTDVSGLKDALRFGVTTELEMMGSWSKAQRRRIARATHLADFRSPGMGITPDGGHPSEYIATSENLLIRNFFKFPSVSNEKEVTAVVAKRVNGGADYIKILLEEGHTVGFPGLPVLSDEVLFTAVREAHRHGKMALAHVTSLVQGKRAIRAGMDGLAHIFFDAAPDQDFMTEIVRSGAFVTPTLTVIASALGIPPTALASDPRVASRLSPQWLHSLAQSSNVYPQGDLQTVMATVLALHRAGVDILAGSDVSEPVPGLGGVAHGASLHHELQLLVAAGLSPQEALRAATSVPARRFGLVDRGRIAVALRADLLLVDGDPLTQISDTLSINTVWRGGVALD